MIIIKLSEVAAGVVNGDNEVKELVFIDQQSGIQIVAPLPYDAAQTLGKQILGTGIEVANQLPADVPKA